MFVNRKPTYCIRFFKKCKKRRFYSEKRSGASENKSFEQLISDFYEMIYGCEIDEEEMKVMKEVAREAGVAYEAD